MSLVERNHRNVCDMRRDAHHSIRSLSCSYASSSSSPHPSWRTITSSRISDRGYRSCVRKSMSSSWRRRISLKVRSISISHTNQWWINECELPHVSSIDTVDHCVPSYSLLAQRQLHVCVCVCVREHCPTATMYDNIKHHGKKKYW